MLRDEGIDEFVNASIARSTLAAPVASVIAPDTMSLADAQMGKLLACSAPCIVSIRSIAPCAVAQEIVNQIGVTEIDADMWRSLPPLVQDQVFQVREHVENMCCAPYL